jgi:hypothetical protein
VLIATVSEPNFFFFAKKKYQGSDRGTGGVCSFRKGGRLSIAFPMRKKAKTKKRNAFSTRPPPPKKKKNYENKKKKAMRMGLASRILAGAHLCAEFLAGGRKNQKKKRISKKKKKASHPRFSL